MVILGKVATGLAKWPGVRAAQRVISLRPSKFTLNGTLAAGGVLFSQRLLRGPGGPFVSFLKWKETDVGMT